MVTPSKGTLVLEKNDPEGFFEMCKVGLGSLGIVTEYTLKCVPLYKLKDEIQIFERDNIADNHLEKLIQNRHLRNLWIPYTNCVVTYQSNISD